MSIVAQGVARRFGDVEAIRSMSFEARPGEVTALIGPNGAGKTTLMLVLASLVAPDAGTVRVAGFDPVTQPREVRRRLGWMPDTLGAWDGLTCHRGLTLAGRLYDLPPRRAAQRADEVLHVVGLQAFRDRPARVLSRGQKQKLSLARALLHEPPVLLLDEPASGLDPAARVELRDLLKALAAYGATVLLSSHVLADLEEVASRAVFVRDGTTVDADTIRRSRTSRRRWRIRALDPAHLDDALATPGLPVPVADARRAPNGEVTLGFADDDAAAHALATLVGRGVRVSLFAPESGELEHTYLDLARQPAPPPQPAVPRAPQHPTGGAA